MPELIRDDQDGMLVDYGDVTELRRCMTELAADAGLRSRLDAQAAARIREGFDIRVVATRYMELFTSLPAARGRQAR